MSDTVFILGAGASAEAGAPVVRTFLDAADRLLRTGAIPHKEDQVAFDLVARGRAALDAVYAKAAIDADDLEAVFGAFEMAALFEQPLGPLTVDEVKQLPAAITQVIVRTLEELVVFPMVARLVGGEVVEAPAPYGEFQEIVQAFLTRSDPVSIITFNYDLALDFALSRAGIQIDYGLSSTAPRPGLVGAVPQPDPSRPLVQLLKLHGSLNWMSCTNAQSCGGIIAGDLEQLARWEREPRRAPDGRRLRVNQQLHHCTRCGGQTATPRPVIVPPTWTKNHHHQGVSSVWRRAAQCLRRASRIVVIGYSLPVTDQFFRYLYALGTVGETRLQQFLVVDPNERIGRRFRQLLGRGVERRFVYRQWTFGGAIAPLNALLIEGEEWTEAVEPAPRLKRVVDLQIPPWPKP